MFQIGKWSIEQPTILAPMAGVSDQPFRMLCRQLGAGLAVSEMITSDSRLWNSRKSRQRLPHADDREPRSIQLAGNDPTMMADAARLNETMGAQIIDINMGCPAKKVCKKAAGSALLKDEKLVANILEAVVNAVSVPVTLKIRTGWSPEYRNGAQIAHIAQNSGIQALAVHGRTRACAFKGKAEYDTIASIVNAVSIPVFANGDIDSPEKSKEVIDYTGANAVMIGRGAQGNPWLFREINHYLATGDKLPKPSVRETYSVLFKHLKALHLFYGEQTGARIARKHVNWYLQYQATRLDRHMNNHSRASSVCKSDGLSFTKQYQVFRTQFNRIESTQEQYDRLASYFETLATIEEKAA